MKYQVHYSTPARKEIKKLTPAVQRRLRTKLEYFFDQDDPRLFAEKLTKPRDAQYRWRVGVYRILFDFDGKVLTIIRVQHRREVYRR